MAGTSRRTTRPRGSIEELPSGSLRVAVYAGIDPVSKRRNYLRETVPSSPNEHLEAGKVMRRLATQVDERRSPRTGATVDQLLDKHFEMADLDRSTLSTYKGCADRHIWPPLGNAGRAHGYSHQTNPLTSSVATSTRIRPGRRAPVPRRTPRPDATGTRGPSGVEQAVAHVETVAEWLWYRA